MPISLRTVLIALIGLVAVGGLVTSGVLGTVTESALTPQTESTQFCGEPGVSLVIDFGSKSDRKIVTACSPNFSGNGWELFAATSHKVEGTAEYPVGFVCRIDGYPEVSEQNCTDTPTGDQGSWAYYFATSQIGENWMFSGAGAGTRKPVCGDVDAWVFINPGEKIHEPSIKPQTYKCSQ